MNEHIPSKFERLSIGEMDGDGVDISIPLQFNGPQPNAYGVEPARSVPCEAGELVGDTRRGGSCNFEQYTFIPHCSGTHTECVGHITHERISVTDCLRDVFLPALLVTVEPQRVTECGETYPVAMNDSDLLLTRHDLTAAIDALASSSHLQDTALIVRTTPNNDSKLTRSYKDRIPPYFSDEAIKFVAECGFKHLIVDLPSIDRLYDEGVLSNHRIFWNVERGSFETDESTRVGSTITELAYIPDGVPDGPYLLNLQVAPFASDAAPSRPVIFKAR